MKSEAVLNIFKETDALLEGHFLLTSGLHSPQYFQCARVIQYPIHAQKLCWEIAYHFMTQEINVVVAPAVGGIVVAHEVGRLIKARAIFAERVNNKMTLRRGFEIFPYDNVLVVDVAGDLPYRPVDILNIGLEDIMNLANPANLLTQNIVDIVKDSAYNDYSQNPDGKYTYIRILEGPGVGNNPLTNHSVGVDGALDEDNEYTVSINGVVRSGVTLKQIYSEFLKGEL